MRQRQRPDQFFAVQHRLSLPGVENIVDTSGLQIFRIIIHIRQISPGRRYDVFFRIEAREIQRGKDFMAPGWKPVIWLYALSVVI